MDADDDDETTAALKAWLAQTSSGSLHRHLSLLLEKRLQQNEDRMRWEVERHERYQQRLRSKGVSKENVRLLLHDSNEPFPHQ